MSNVKLSIVKPKLEHIDIEVTRNCNYKCIHCSTGNHKNLTINELSYEEIKNAIEASYVLGLNKLGLTGGEPLLEEEKLFSIIDFGINSLDLPIHIHTNGSLLTKKIAEKLNKRDVLVTISIFSCDKSINDQITRLKGSYELTLNGIKNAIEQELDFQVFIVPTNKNVYTIKETILRLHGIGAEKFRILSLSPTGEAIKTYEKIKLSESEIETLSSELKVLKNNYSIDIQTGFCTHQNLPQLPYLRGHDQCYSGKNRLHIDSYGNVFPCTAASGRLVFSAGNIRNVELGDIWFNSPLLQFIRRFHLQKHVKCQNCIKYEECMGGCRIKMSYLYRDYTCVKPGCGGPFSRT